MFWCEHIYVAFSTIYVGYLTLRRKSAYWCRKKISCSAMGCLIWTLLHHWQFWVKRDYGFCSFGGKSCKFLDATWGLNLTKICVPIFPIVFVWPVNTDCHHDMQSAFGISSIQLSSRIPKNSGYCNCRPDHPRPPAAAAVCWCCQPAGSSCCCSCYLPADQG